MSGVPSTPSTPGRCERGDEALEQVAAARHGGAGAADAEGAAGRVVGGDEEHPAVLARRAGGAAGRPSAAAMRPGSRTRISVRSATATLGLTVGSTGVVVIAPPRRRWRTVRPAGRRCQALLDLGGGRHRGGALELLATIAPATLANSRTRRRSQPASRPWHERAAEGVAGAEAVDDLDGEGRHLDALVAGRGEHPLGALLDDGELDAALEQRVGRPLRVGLADGDLALLAVADGDGDVRRARVPTCSLASAGSAQNIGR